MAFFTIFFNLSQEAILSASRIWLAKWTSSSNVTLSERNRYLGVYGGFGLAQFIAVLIAAFLLTFGCLKASRNLHQNLLRNIMHCPMSFFETTPTGRLMNRFSKEVNTVDEKIPNTMRDFFETFVGVLGVFFIISYTTPVFLGVLVVLIIFYGMVQVS